MTNANLGTATGQINIDTTGLDSAAVAIRRAGTGLVAFGGILVSGLAAATGAAAGFETRISELRAVTSAAEDQIQTLRDAALELGTKGPFGPTQVADAFVELAKAGISATDIINGAGQSTINLAKAGDLPIARAAEIASNTMKTFQLNTDQLTHSIDILVGAANASTIDVDDLATSLKYVGSVAQAQGITLDDTATALAELGNAGLKGSTGGTVLRRILLELSPTTKPAVQALTDLGIIAKDGSNAFFDEAGNAKDLATIFQILQDKTRGLTREQKVQTLETVFGARAVAGALFLMEGGADSFKKMEAEIGKSDASTAAALRLDNLEGSIRKFHAALQALLIDAGSPFQKAFKGIVDKATELLQVMQKIPTPIVVAALAIAAFIGVLAIISGTILLILFPILALSIAINQLPAALLVVRGAMIAFRAATVGSFISGIQAMLSATVSFDLVLGATTVTITTTVGVILGIIAVIAILVVGFILLYQHSETFRRGLARIGEFFASIPGLILSAWGGVVNFFQSIWTGILDGASAAIGWLKSNWDIVLTILTGPFGAVILIIRRFGDDIIGFFGKIVGFFERLGSSIFGFFESLPGRVGGAIASFTSEALSDLANFGTSLVENVVSAIQALPKLVAYNLGFIIGRTIRILVLLPFYAYRYFKEFGEIALGFTIRMVTSVVGAMKDFTNRVIKEVLALPGRIKSIFLSITDAAKNFAINLVTGIIGLGKRFADSLIDGLLALPGKIKDIFNSILEIIKSTTLSILGGVANVGKDIGNAIVSGILGIPAAVVGIFNTAKEHIFTIGIDMFNTAKGVAGDIYRGIRDGIAGIPDLVAGIFKSAWQKIKDGAKDAANAAKGWASSAWQGFKDGLGIHSPSFIERATTTIVKNSTKDFDRLRKQMTSLASVQNQFASVPKGVGGIVNNNNQAAIGPTNNINIYNPATQTTEDSLFSTMLKLAYLGLDG